MPKDRPGGYMDLCLWALLAPTLGAIGAGFWLDRRYGKAIRYEGIGRPYPIGWSVLAFLGNAMILMGLIAAMIIGFLLFN